MSPRGNSREMEEEGMALCPARTNLAPPSLGMASQFVSPARRQHRLEA